jgi:hypothetical protein
VGELVGLGAGAWRMSRVGRVGRGGSVGRGLASKTGVVALAIPVPLECGGVGIMSLWASSDAVRLDVSDGVRDIVLEVDVG